MILGFIGTGKISSSIIFGIFKSKLKVKKIYISSRNRSIAKKIANKFRLVKILKDNQEIINKSSIIILGDFPPSSWLTLFTVFADAVATAIPPRVDPVNDIISISL